jgi:hypothetical protein
MAHLFSIYEPAVFTIDNYQSQEKAARKRRLFEELKARGLFN